jgi:hypothetical protein
MLQWKPRLIFVVVILVLVASLSGWLGFADLDHMLSW